MKERNLTIMTHVVLVVMLVGQMIQLTVAWLWMSRGVWSKALTSSLVFIFLGMMIVCVLIISSIRSCRNKMEEILQLLKEDKSKRE